MPYNKDCDCIFSLYLESNGSDDGLDLAKLKEDLQNSLLKHGDPFNKGLGLCLKKLDIYITDPVTGEFPPEQSQHNDLTTMAVSPDGALLVNYDFAQQIGKDESLGVFAHEAYHVLNGTFSRGESKGVTPHTHVVWNIATDFVMNNDLQQRGWSLPSGGCLSVTQSGDTINNKNWGDGQYVQMDPARWDPSFADAPKLNFEITNQTAEYVYDQLIEWFKENVDEPEGGEGQSDSGDGELSDAVKDAIEKMAAAENPDGDEHLEHPSDEDDTILDDIKREVDEELGNVDGESDDQDQGGDEGSAAGTQSAISMFDDLPHCNEPWVGEMIKYLGIKPPPQTSVLPTRGGPKNISITQPGMMIPQSQTYDFDGQAVTTWGTGYPSLQPSPPQAVPTNDPGPTIHAGIFVDQSGSVASYNGEWMAPRLLCIFEVAWKLGVDVMLTFIRNGTGRADNYPEVIDKAGTVSTDMPREQVRQGIIDAYNNVGNYGTDSLRQAASAAGIHKTEVKDFIYFTDMDWTARSGYDQHTGRPDSAFGDDGNPVNVSGTRWAFMLLRSGRGLGPRDKEHIAEVGITNSTIITVD